MHSMVFIMRSKHLAVHREATRAVSNMLSSTAFHKLFLDDGGLVSLFQNCRSLDTETVFNCSLIFRKLTPVLANHDAIVGKGGLEPLQFLTRSHDLASQRQAAAAMRDLASNVNYKAIMAEEGCLLRAIELGKNSDLELRILGLGTIRHLVINTRVKRPFYEQGGLSPVFMGVEDSVQDLDLLRQCSAILAITTENAENQVSFVKDGVLPRLVHLSTVDSLDIQRDVAKTYASLTANPENQVGVFGAAEVKSLLKLCDNIDEPCRRDALVCIGNLAVTNKNQLMIAKLGALPVLARGMTSEFETCQRFSCRAIYRLAANVDIQVGKTHIPPRPVLT